MTCGAEQRLEQLQHHNMSNMVRMVGLMFWALLLGLGLSYTAQAVNAAQRSASPGAAVGTRVGQVGGVATPEKLGHRIEGELLRIEGKDYFVMGKGGLRAMMN